MSELVTIFIPTRGRVKQLENNLQLLKDNTHYKNYEVIIIIDNDDKDTLSLCNNNKLNYLIRFHREYFATKVNAAFRNCSGKYLICLSDDVEPEADWLQIALDCFKTTFPDDIGVLCFNDYGCYEGKLAIHPFVSREWVDRYQYGQWLLWPDYWHFYGDTELSIIAKYINKYVYCKESKVKHTLQSDPENRDGMWWSIRTNVYPIDLKIFKHRGVDGFPGYGPDKIKVPSFLEVKKDGIFYK